MKRILTAIVLSLSVGCATVFAADMPLKAPQPTMPAWNWTGFYIGANVGAGWSNGDIHATPAGTAPPWFDPVTLALNGTSAVGGIQAGYNWQLNPNLLLGLEGDIDGGRINASNALTPVTFGGAPFPGPVTATASRNIDWLASVRGRVGVTWDRTLLYATGGVAFSQMGFAGCSNCNNLGGPTSYPSSFTSTRTGFVVGAGAEYALAANWTVRGEYLYYRFSGVSSTVTGFPTPLAGVSARYDWADPSVQVVRLGVNYKFGAGPVVAKY